MIGDFTLKQLFSIFLLCAVVLVTAGAITAWTGPTATPPDGNAPAPINVGTTDQTKDANLGVNGLAVFGNTILSGTSPRYLNFGDTSGSGGYGFRDNSGTMQFKNSGGAWSSFVSSINNLSDVNASSATDGQVLTYNSISANWEAADASGGSGSCPSGFTSANDQYCIQTDEISMSTSWWNANDSCFAINARLCTWGEWYSACSNVAGLSSMVGGEGEWVDDAPNNSGNGKLVGHFSCTSERDNNNLTDLREARCCYTK